MAENLLKWIPDLTDEEREAVAGAAGTGPSGLLYPRYRYYRDAARDPVCLGLLDRQAVICRLRKWPFWPQAREALRKLERDR